MIENEQSVRSEEKEEEEGEEEDVEEEAALIYSNVTHAYCYSCSGSKYYS